MILSEHESLNFKNNDKQWLFTLPISNRNSISNLPGLPIAVWGCIRVYHDQRNATITR